MTGARADGGARIPLPEPASPPHGPAGNRCAGIVTAFLERTNALSCEAAAELAGVRPDTIRKWRRRLPRWLKASTARQLAACTGGEASPAPGDGFRDAFRRVMRDRPPAV